MTILNNRAKALAVSNDRATALAAGLKTVAAAGLVTAALSVYAASAQAADAITIGATRLASQAATFIAMDRGYFKDEGIDAKIAFFQSAQPIAVAIASGDVDFGMTAITGGLVNLAEKDAVRVIGGALTEEPGVDGNIILASKQAYDAGLTSPDKLAGHSFGITQQGSSFHYMAAKIAEGSGFDLSTMRLVPLQKVGAVSAALSSGQIDAWAIQPNVARTLEAKDAAVAIGKVSDYAPNYQVTTIFTSLATTKEKPDLVKKVLKALSHGAADYNAALVDKTADAKDADAVTAIVAKYAYPDMDIAKSGPAISEGAMRLSKDASLNVKSVADQLDWMKSQKLVPASASIDKLVDGAFVETK